MNLIFLIISSQISTIYSLTSYLLDEKIEDCKKNGSFPYIDFSTVKFTIVNDSLTVVDGKIKHLKKVSSPWKVYFYGEKYDRGQWLKMIERRLDDFCNHVQKPLELWYLEFYKFLKGKQCPYPEGFEIDFDNFPIDLSNLYLPPTWFGRWRFITMSWLGKYPGYSECNRFYLDFYDS